MYNHLGQKISEYREAYTGTDSRGNFMSFGDGNVLDGKLYITAYNFNSRARPLESRIVVWSLPDLGLISEHDIGEGLAESVRKYDESYWVAYHDEMVARRFDADYRLLDSYELSQPKGKYGGYQGSYWDGDDLLLQMHGPNKHERDGAKGLD